MPNKYPVTPRIKNVFFLNTVKTTTPYGVTLAEHALSIVDNSANNVFPFGGIDFRSMFLPYGSYQETIAEVDAIVKPTEPTLTNSLEYGFTIAQFDPYRKEWFTHRVFASTADIGTPAVGSIALAWQAQINLYRDLRVTTSITGAVLTITATSGYPLILVSNLMNGVTLTSGTAGVVGLGNTTDMTANGYSTLPGYVSSNTYAQCIMNWETSDGGKYQTIMFVNTGDTNYAVFKTSLVTNTFKINGLTVAEAALAVD